MTNFKNGTLTFPCGNSVWFDLAPHQWRHPSTTTKTKNQNINTRQPFDTCQQKFSSAQIETSVSFARILLVQKDSHARNNHQNVEVLSDWIGLMCEQNTRNQNRNRFTWLAKNLDTKIPQLNYMSNKPVSDSWCTPKPNCWTALQAHSWSSTHNTYSTEHYHWICSWTWRKMQQLYWSSIEQEPNFACRWIVRQSLHTSVLCWNKPKINEFQPKNLHCLLKITEDSIEDDDPACREQ